MALLTIDLQRLCSSQQVADTPRAQRVLSRSGMASFATRMTPIADEAPSAADAAAAGFGAVLSMPAAAGPPPPAHQPTLVLAQQFDSTGSAAAVNYAATDRSPPAVMSPAAAAAGADVFLPPSSGGSAASRLTFESALTSGSSSAGGSSSNRSSAGGGIRGVGGSASAVAPTGTAPQLQVASAPPAAPAADAASSFQLPDAAVGTASAGPKTGRRRPVRRVLTFTEADGSVSAVPPPAAPWADSPPAAAAGVAAAGCAAAAGSAAAGDAAAAAAAAPVDVLQCLGDCPTAAGNDDGGRANLLPVAWQVNGV